MISICFKKNLLETTQRMLLEYEEVVIITLDELK